MEAKDRIKEVRKSLKLSREKFGQRLDVSENYIYMIESGKRAVSDKFVYVLCNEFNVNKEWILEGTGAMFDPRSIEEEIADITVDIIRRDDLDAKAKERLVKIVKSVAQMDEQGIDAIMDLARDIAEAEKNATD